MLFEIFFVGINLITMNNNLKNFFIEIVKINNNVLIQILRKIIYRIN